MKSTRLSSSGSSGSVLARLEFTVAGAREVCVAGSFNDWHPTACPMIDLGNGLWAKELALPVGRYEYRFVVDGVWMDDPAATESVPNLHGSRNAVLNVVAPAKPKRPRAAGSAPRARKSSVPSAGSPAAGAPPMSEPPGASSRAPV